MTGLKEIPIEERSGDEVSLRAGARTQLQAKVVQVRISPEATLRRQPGLRRYPGTARSPA
jgi:methylthioribose-1-phosphate isomerase